MKKLLHLRLIGWGLLSLIVATFSWSVAQAQEKTQLTVSPVTFELSANPGDTLTNQIKVTNLSDSSLQLTTNVENIASTGQGGEVKLTEDNTSYSISSWVSSNPTELSLDPKQSQFISFTIKVPSNAEPGGHYGSLLVGTEAARPGVTGSAIAQRIGSLLLVKVSGQTKEQAYVSQFRAKTFSGSWDTVSASDGKSKVLIAKGEDTSQEKALRYFKSGPIAFDVLFHNSGNVHVKPVGQVTIFNVFNQKVAELPLDAHNVFPQGDRLITVIWPQTNLWGGYYRAELTTIYGDNQPLIASTTFWAFPLWAAIAIGAVLLIIITLRRRLGRAFRILIKGA